MQILSNQFWENQPWNCWNNYAGFKALQNHPNAIWIPNWKGLCHPSLGNYLGVMAGKQYNCPNDPDCPTTRSTLTKSDHTIANLIDAKGLKWKQYIQSLPPSDAGKDFCNVGRTNGVISDHHGSLREFSSTGSTSEGWSGIQTLDQLWTDLKNGTLADLNIMELDLCGGGHNELSGISCGDTLAHAAQSASDLIENDLLPNLEASPQWKSGSLYFFGTFDEDEIKNPGANVVGAVLMNKNIAGKTVTTTGWTHYNWLSTMEYLFTGSHGQLGTNDSASPLTSLLPSQKQALLSVSPTSGKAGDVIDF